MQIHLTKLGIWIREDLYSWIILEVFDLCTIHLILEFIIRTPNLGQMKKKNSNLFLKLVICFNWHFNCSNLLDQIGTSKNMLKNYFVKVQVFEKATKIWSNLPRSFDRNRKIELYKNWSDISLLVNYQNNFPNKIPWFCCH